MKARELLRIFDRKRLAKEGKMFQRAFIGGFVECERRLLQPMYDVVKARRRARRAFEDGRKLTVKFAKDGLRKAAKQ